MNNIEGTPDLSPVTPLNLPLVMTPLTLGNILKNEMFLGDDFSLDAEVKTEGKKKKHKNKRLLKRVDKKMEDGSPVLGFILVDEDGLEQILGAIEEEHDIYVEEEPNESDGNKKINGYYEDDYDSHYYEEESEESSSVALTEKLVDEKTLGVGGIDATDLLRSNDQLFQNWNIGYTPCSCNDLLFLIDKIAEKKELGDLDKIAVLREELRKYLLDYELYSYEEAWNYLNKPFQEIAEIIKDKINETFAKIVGTLSFCERRSKVLKYLSKKKRRIWHKKVSYVCRKNVADNRLRIKGKFVTHEQACEQLGLSKQALKNLTCREIKMMFEQQNDDKDSDHL